MEFASTLPSTFRRRRAPASWSRLFFGNLASFSCHPKRFRLKQQSTSSYLAFVEDERQDDEEDDFNRGEEQ
jgi:hypothetical protein